MLGIGFVFLPMIIFLIVFVVIKRRVFGSQRDVYEDLQGRMNEKMNLLLDAVISGNEEAVISEYLNTPEKRRLNAFKETAVVCTGYLQWVYDEKVRATYRSWDGFEREVEVDISPDIARANERLEIKVYVSPNNAEEAMVDREEVLMAIENRK